MSIFNDANKFISGLSYEASDLLYESAYEWKVKNYKEKVKKLNEYKRNLDNYIKVCEEAVINFNQIYQCDSDLYGEAVELFLERSKEVKDKIDKCIGHLKEASSEISKKIEKANELKSYFDQKCIEEDKELKKKWEEKASGK